MNPSRQLVQVPISEMGSPFKVHSQLKTDMEIFQFSPQKKTPLKQMKIIDMFQDTQPSKKNFPHRTAHDKNPTPSKKVDSEDESENECEIINSEDG